MGVSPMDACTHAHRAQLDPARRASGSRVFSRRKRSLREVFAAARRACEYTRPWAGCPCYVRMPCDAGKLPLGRDLRARAFDDGEELLLLLRGNPQLVERRLEVADGGVEVSVGDAHVRVNVLHRTALVLRRAARRQLDELRDVLLHVRHGLRVALPLQRSAAAEAEPALLDAGAAPIHARVLQRAIDPVLDDCVDALVPAEPLVERLLRRRLIAPLPAELLDFGDLLLGALIRLAAAGCVKVPVLLLLIPAADQQRHANHDDRRHHPKSDAHVVPRSKSIIATDGAPMLTDEILKLLFS